jgi:hypothetical protein
MRQNARYTNIILTIIAFALVILAVDQFAGRNPRVRAAGKFVDVQFVTGGNGVLAINTATGDIWDYSLGGMYGFKVKHVARIEELGKAPVVDSAR